MSGAQITVAVTANGRLLTLTATRDGFLIDDTRIGSNSSTINQQKSGPIWNRL